METSIETFRIWLHNTSLADLMLRPGAWPVAESLHFIGLSLLIGTIGLFDLRMLGFAKQVPLNALHRLVPWGVLGYLINVVTGISFFTAEADQYMYNPAFQMKMLFMALAGINVAVFYLFVYRKVKSLGSGDDPPLAARVIGGASLVLWIGVMSAGRLLTFFRPPMRWCPWC